MVADSQRRSTVKERRRTYTSPSEIHTVPVGELLKGRIIEPAQRARLTLPGLAPDATPDVIFYAGNLNLVRRPCVAIVGSRRVSDAGAKRAWQLARDLARAGVVVVSGLAEGVDINAHKAAIAVEGKTIAVIGTPLDKAYPAKHAQVQELLYTEHLVVSQFNVGTRVFPSNFPQRNKLMAAMADATVIIEASDTSGTLHQAAECSRIDRWLFITRSVANDSSLEWPRKFLGKAKVRVLERVEDVLEVLAPHVQD